MKIIETMLCGKFDQQRCEDSLFVSDDFVAVIDGVSSKTDFRFEGKTTGKLASEFVVETLKTLPREAELPELLNAINQRFARFYEDVPAFPPEEREDCGLQAVCVVYSAYRRTIWQIGDCQVLVDGMPYANVKKSDAVICAMRGLMLDILEMRDGETRIAEHDKEVLDLLFPWMVAVSAFANDPKARYGYCVLNGQEIPLQMVNTIPLEAGEHEVVLASDGYPCLEPTLKQSEQGLEKLLRDDPQGRCLFASARSLGEGQKSFDDRTYIRFLIEE